MNHVLKLLLRIIHNRIRNKCEEDLEETQFGFRNSFGTREALFSLTTLLQKCRDQRKDVYICFVDYEKAFDKIQHNKLLTVLQETGIDERDIRLIKNLYWRQRACIKIGDKTTNEINIQCGVRQGCILSPLLFNLYSDKVFKRALQDQEYGVKVNGELINTIRYADDTAIISDSLEGLQHLLNSVNESGQEMGLNINIKKTKFMVITREPQPNAALELNNQRIEKVNSFKYLGAYITDQLDPDKEIRSTIEVARATFNMMRTLFCNDSLNLKVRQQMVKCYIWSILLYSSKAWTLKVSTVNRLETLEMWIPRKMLRIPWVDRVTNAEVLRRANVNQELLTIIKGGKICYLGHVLRGSRYRILQLIMKRKIEGKREIGRKQLSWLKHIRDWTGIRSADQLFRIGEDRERIAIVIVNIRGTWTWYLEEEEKLSKY